MKFTDAGVRALKASAARYEVWEDNSRGFGVRVAPSGRKSWVSLLRARSKVRRITHGAACEAHGSLELLTLADARCRHHEALEKASRGLDPASEVTLARREEREAPTVAMFAAHFLAVRPSTKSQPRAKTFADYKRLLDRHIIPAIGHLPLREVRRREVVALIDQVRAAGRHTLANRIQSLCVRLFNVALDKGWIEATPLASLRMPRERARERVLTEVELRTFWRATAAPDLVSRALRLCLLTAQRRGEVAQARVEQFDLEGALWTLPSSVTKNGKPHRVPLSPGALAIVRAAVADAIKAAKDADQEPGFLFPSRTTLAGHLEPNSLSRAVARLQPGADRLARYTVHDLRRTAATTMEALGTARLVVGLVLNHSDPSTTGKHYALHHYDQEKRAALDRWAAFAAAGLRAVA